MLIRNMNGCNVRLLVPGKYIDPNCTKFGLHLGTNILTIIT